MRSISAPNEDPKEVFELCVNSISDKRLRCRLSAVSDVVAAAAYQYWKNGIESTLYSLPSNDCKNEEIVIGSVNKQELKDVYSVHMVGRAKPARKIYDSLLSRAPHGRCPFCGIGNASTLDHYLPKSRYPTLSVVPQNLVPSCKDCNTGKKANISTVAEKQSLHPYFDNSSVISEQWIFADVESTYPETVRFFVRAPEDWDETLKKRVHSHFEDFNLANRFSIEAADELANKRYLLTEFERKNGAQALIDLLSDEADSHFRVHKNSWQTAFYQALHEHYMVSKKSQNQATKVCPVCDGEGVFVNYFCPCCSGNGIVSGHMEINDSDYQRLKCPECDGRPGCRLCAGSGVIRREKALQLARSRP